MPVSEAAIEAVGGAVGSVISVAVTYPLTIVSLSQMQGIAAMIESTL